MKLDQTSPTILAISAPEGKGGGGGQQQKIVLGANCILQVFPLC